MPLKILAIAGPTASGKSARAVSEALVQGGEVISVDSRQVYRTLDIGTEKITPEEMRGVPHHLIDIRDPETPYSAGEFAADATRLIKEISARGKLPVLVGGSHFYFDALLKGLPDAVPTNFALRETLETRSTKELFAELAAADPRRTQTIDAKNRRRLIRALEIIAAQGAVSIREPAHTSPFVVSWIVIDPPLAELRERIEKRLVAAISNGLIEEVRAVRARVGDARLTELGLEYRVIGEYLRNERTEDSLFPTLSRELLAYAKRQKAWLRKLRAESVIAGA